MPVSEVLYVENDSPGFTAQCIASASSWINGRLRKRYGNNHRANSLPLGQSPPALIASGQAPPGLQFAGVPTLGSLQMLITITTPGLTGTAVFTWSADAGITNTTGVVSAPAVSLGATGLVLQMPAASTGLSFSLGNVYAAATPVPEIVLGWLTTLVTYQLYRKRGINPQDPQIELLVADVKRVQDEVKEAADSKDGLFDLPASEDEDSAVTTGGPFGVSQTSPYVWTDIERTLGVAQDAQYEDFIFPIGFI